MMPESTDNTATPRPYLSTDLPGPAPTMDECTFWGFCARRELRFQRCGNCGRHRHPPSPICPSCRSERIDWTSAPSVAEIYSYTIVHYASHPAVQEALPYNVAILSFPGLDDVRLISNVVDVPPEEIAVGLRVELTWEGPVDGYFLPRFRRLQEGGA